MQVAHVVFNLPLSKSFLYQIPKHLIHSIVPGRRVRVPLGNKTVTGYVVNVSTVDVSVIAYPLKPVYECLDTTTLLTPELIELARWMAQAYGCGQGEVLAAMLPPGLSVKRTGNLVDSTLFAPHCIKPHRLTDDQYMILDAVNQTIHARSCKKYLIHGITGSGKTEIYLQAMETALAIHRQALYLVPEISMTPIFIGQLRARFGEKVGIWHSQMSKSERLTTIKRVLNGDIAVILGARSAIFAPFTNLGIIVIDEEHDESYKQDKRPYYHARSIAEKRSEFHGAVLILGSATPSLESYARARDGKYQLFHIPHRIDRRPLPRVSMVHLGGQRSGRMNEIFSDEMITAVRKRLARREQVMLFLNRRGYAPFVRCTQCGWVARCAQCAISLVYHRKEQAMSVSDSLPIVPVSSGTSCFAELLSTEVHAVSSAYLECHYCGTRYTLPSQCPACSLKTIRVAGIGTQKIEREISSLFPHARVARLDRDTAGKRGYAAQVYRAFGSEDIDILLGTQIITKGFDFPRVTLIGVVDADIALHLPDFKAAERTFQVLTQVGGRAGRGTTPGEVLIQTFYPGHYALKAAADHDYHSFFKQEIEFRRSLGYPPSTYIMNCVFRGKNEKMVERESRRFSELLNAHIDKDIEIIGPTPALRSMLHKKYRWQIILKSKHIFFQKIFGLYQHFKVKQGVQVSIEPEPVSLL
ncbi:MAG: primosomal protein N' [Elusimicrobia bacterium]|nr:primosomal protein N' [Elusimicrobiota bacterium]MBD3412370.1 primosomal protein N' [Elusimicrobiota bacterium]